MFRTIRWFITTGVVVLLGFLVAYHQDIQNLTNIPSYTTVVYTLLAVGLYGSVYSINLEELSHNRSIVIQAVTIGVLFKVGFIGALFYLLTSNPFSFLIAIVVAQIDPLSVARLLNDEETQLSKRAKSILGAWASFDDPVTVLASVYIASLVLPTMASTGGAYFGTGIVGYVTALALNLSLAGIIYVLHRRYTDNDNVISALFLATFILCVIFHLMLAVALIGLYLRPRFGNFLPFIVNVSLYISLFMLGMLAVEGISLKHGFILATGATISQIIAALFLTRTLELKDRLYLAVSQQNGITAIILALLVASAYPGIVAIIAPAIFIINSMHIVLNLLVEKSLQRQSTGVSVD